MGAQSLRGHDALHGSEAWDRVRPRFVETLDNEYFTPDGSYAHIRSNHVGLSWDTGEVPGRPLLHQRHEPFVDILPAMRVAPLRSTGTGKKITALSKMVVDGRDRPGAPGAARTQRARRSALAGGTA
jgi:hypothetical protein